MHNDIILRLVDENPEMVLDRLVNLYWALSTVLAYDVPGEVVEVGCYAGKTSVFLSMLIEHFDGSRTLHVYDSFQGLPSPGPLDGYLNQGDFATTVEALVATFARWQVSLPVVHAGWFADTLPEELPEVICFAYIDADFYDSILVALTHVYPRLASGAVLVVDDYADVDRSPRAFDLLPGPKAACDEFFADKPETVSVLVGAGDLAFGYLRKAM